MLGGRGMMPGMGAGMGPGGFGGAKGVAVPPPPRAAEMPADAAPPQAAPPMPRLAPVTRATRFLRVSMQSLYGRGHNAVQLKRTLAVLREKRLKSQG